MRKQKSTLSLIFLLLIPLMVLGSVPKKHHIIIDTDCAPDDLRAINLLLSSEDVEILAITSVDGALEPEDGYLKISTLLHELGHEGIPTTQGILAKNKTPEWADFVKTVKWGEEIISYDQPAEVKEFLINTIEKEEQPVELVCLGPLTNVANAILMKPAIKQKIKRIIWFDQCLEDSKWTNYGMDCPSADYILQIKIPVYRVKTGEKKFIFNQEFYQSIGNINTPYARNIYKSHSSDSIQQKIKAGNLQMWDELVALYLFYPGMFQQDTTFSDSKGTVMEMKDPEQVYDKMLHHLKLFNNQDNIVFKNFPQDTSFYKADVKPFADSIINHYGLKEWKALVLTNEIHDHLGLYSIIGAKMGIRAIEYFHTNSDHIEIESSGGNKPPLSCFNDGLQVGSGSTMGNGSFKIMEGDNSPKAVVTFNDKSIEIQLKTKYHNQIQQTIIKTKNLYGLESEKYWNTIRKKGIEIWQNFDRKEIFTIRELN